jgi:diguanylate cyclase (GGDEF)-like protein
LTVVIVLLLWFYRRQQNVQRRLAEERLRDVLTGLPQRRMFDMRLQAAFARQKRYGGTVALLYCDLDEFKAVNDQHGHLVGDQLLCAVAERLTSAVRENDFVVRFGDEFGALVEGTSLAELAELVSRLQTIVQKPVTLGGVEITPRLSVGGAITTGGRGRDELVRAADLAMYQVKAGAPGLVLTDLDRPATASPSEAATDSGS